MSCLICLKQEGNSEIKLYSIHQEEDIIISHAAIPDNSNEVYRGWLIIEPKRHVSGWEDLETRLAAALGIVIKNTCKLLRSTLNIDKIYTYTLGHQVDHLHIHVVPRYVGTPREYWGMKVDEWPDAPKIDKEELEEFTKILRNNYPN